MFELLILKVHSLKVHLSVAHLEGSSLKSRSSEEAECFPGSADGVGWSGREVVRKGDRRRSPGQSESGWRCAKKTVTVGKGKRTNDWVGAFFPGAPREVAGPLAAIPGVSAVNKARSEAEGKYRVTVPQPVSEREAGVTLHLCSLERTHQKMREDFLGNWKT